MKFLTWKRNKSEEIAEMGVLYSSLVDANKIGETEYKPYVKASVRKDTKTLKKEAIRRFIKSQNKVFWDKVNVYNHNLVDLAKQVCQRSVAKGASATYLNTGVSVTKGQIVCLGTVIGLHYEMPNYSQNKIFLHSLDEMRVLNFLTKYAKYSLDPLMMLGIWRTKGQWLLSICHEKGDFLASQFDESYYDISLNKIVQL